MKTCLTHATTSQIQMAFDLLKYASQKLERKEVQQWRYWQNPPREKVDWVHQVFEAKKFNWIRNEQNETLGMVRILQKDLQ